MRHVPVSAAAAAGVLMPLVACASTVTLDGGKCIRVNGAPFFPIGLYSAGDPADFPYIARAGFNLVHSYAWEGMRNFDEGQAWLDAADANGLKALIGLCRPRVKAMDFASSAERIQKYRNHPALLAWHTMDEPTWDKEGDMGKEYMPAAFRTVRENDPNHPVTAVVCHFGDPKLFADSMDIGQADYYPIPPIPANWYSGTGFRGIKQFVDNWRDATNGEKPFWFVAQIFDFSVSKEKGNEIPDEWRRLPTGQELRCMTYTAVASGARGILYWSFSRLIGDEWNRTLSGRLQLWDDLRAVVGELNSLMSVLTAGTPEIIHSADGVVAMVKSDGEAIHVIAANHERRETDTVIEIPGVGQGTARVLFGDGEAPITDGKLTAHFEPIGTRAWRIEPQQQ